MESKDCSIDALANIDLSDRVGNFKPLSENCIQELLRGLNGYWHLNSNGYIEKNVLLENYMDGVKMVLWIAQLAEKINHHPDMHLGYKNLSISLSTHNVSSLTLADFVLAAKIESFMPCPTLLS